MQGSHTAEKWYFPEKTGLKLTMTVHFTDSSHKAAIGIIARDHKRKVVAGIGKLVNDDVLVVEALALKEGALITAKEKYASYL